MNQEQKNGERAYHMGRSAYELTKVPGVGWILFGNLPIYTQAYWIAQAAIRGLSVEPVSDKNCAKAQKIEAVSQSALPSELAEYERLFAWRAAWQALSNKREANRLQSRQERIERRAMICNRKILLLMRAFDARVGNTFNPV